MSVLDYVIIGVIAILVILAIYFIRKHKSVCCGECRKCKREL